MKTKKVKKLKLKQNIKDKLQDFIYDISGIIIFLLILFIAFLIFYK